MRHFLLVLSILISLSLHSQNLDNSLTVSNNSEKYDDNPISYFLYSIFAEITYGVLFESYFEKDSPMHDASLTPYPYFTKSEGNYTYDNSSAPFRLELGSNLIVDRHGKYTGYLYGNWRFLKRLELEASYLNLGTYETKQNKFLSQSAFFLNYHRIRTKKLDVWYGMGAIFSQDEPAIAFTLGGEWFFAPHFSFTPKANWGFMKNDRMIKNSSYHLNYYISHWRVQLGLRSIYIPGQHINSFTTGLKFYF